MQDALKSTFSEQIVPFWIVFQESVANIWDHIRRQPWCQKIMEWGHKVLDPAGRCCVKVWDMFIFACGKMFDLCHCNAAGACCRRLACATCCANRRQGKPKQYTNMMLELMLPERRVGRSASEYTVRPRDDTSDESDSLSGSQSLADDRVQSRTGKPTLKPSLGVERSTSKAPKQSTRVQPMEVEEPLPPPPPKKRDAPSKPLPGPPPRRPKKPEAS